jgi:hypothetical protein
MIAGAILCAAIAAAGNWGGERAIVVAPESYRAALEPLVAHRGSQGIACEVVVLEAIEREHPAPNRVRSIQGFFAARFAKEGSVDYVLLVGDAKAIPSPTLGEKGEIVPSDELFLAGEIGSPRPSLGRLSARNAEEARDLVARVLAYETETRPGPWRGRVIFTAGEGGFGAVADGAIEASVRYAIEKTLPEGFALRLVRLPAGAAGGEASLRETLVRALEPGALFWIYAGHGSRRGLASGEAEGFLPGPPARAVASFRAADAGKLRCGERPPVALLFACDTARMEAGRECLAEALVRSNGGPIAVLGASAISHPVGDLTLAFELGRLVSEDGCERLGNWVRRAKRASLRDDPQRADLEKVADVFGFGEAERAKIRRRTAMQYHLYGDPMMRLPRPGRLRIEVDEAEGEFAVSGEVPGEGEGTVIVEALSPPSEASPLAAPARIAQEFSGRGFRVPLDRRAWSTTERIRIYAARGTIEAVGEARLRRP